MRIKIDKCMVCVCVCFCVCVCMSVSMSMRVCIYVCVHMSVCTIYIQAYNVSSFVDHYPAGIDQILFRAGRDITQLFESYHPFSANK